MSTPPSELPPPSGAPSATPAATQTNTLAIVSLATGIGSFFAHIIPGVGGFTVAVIAVITGYMARNQIKKTGEQGMALATIGMVIGIVHIALIVLVVIGLIFIFFVLGGLAIFGATRS